MQESKLPTECTLCAGRNLRLLFRARHLRETQGMLPDQDYHTCQGCGLILLRPLLSEAALRDRYSNASLEAGGNIEMALGLARREVASLRAARLRARPRFLRLASGIYDQTLSGRAPGKVLDIGCGIGAELIRLNNRGWSIYGTDYNRIAIDALNESFPGRFQVSGGGAGGWTEAFDVIMLNQVLEHLVDPQAMLRGLRGMLAPGGQLVIVTPNAASWARSLFGSHWVQYWPPEHVALYGPAQLKRLLSDSGWLTQDISTYAAPGTDYASSVRQLLRLRPEPHGWEKLPWYPLAWLASFVNRSSELVATAVPAPC